MSGNLSRCAAAGPAIDTANIQQASSQKEAGSHLPCMCQGFHSSIIHKKWKLRNNLNFNEQRSRELNDRHFKITLRICDGVRKYSYNFTPKWRQLSVSNYTNNIKAFKQLHNIEKVKQSESFQHTKTGTSDRVFTKLFHVYVQSPTQGKRPKADC